VRALASPRASSFGVQSTFDIELVSTLESPTRDEWDCNIENAFDNEIRITRSVTGRVAKWRMADERRAFEKREREREREGEREREKGVARVPLIKNLSRGEGSRVNYNRPSQLTDV